MDMVSNACRPQHHLQGNTMRILSLVSALALSAVCASQASAACACSTGNYYYVLSGDSCTRIISNYFPGGGAQFKKLNCNMACITTNLYVGQQLCRP